MTAAELTTQIVELGILVSRLQAKAECLEKENQHLRKMAWIEHYAHKAPGEGEETLDLVEFKWANGTASKPFWSRVRDRDRGFERELLAALKDQEGDLPESFMTRFYEAGFISR
jgi:hypothetical protein